MTDNNFLSVKVKDHIMSITLDRPEALNAFKPEMIAGMKEALDKAQHDPDIRVVTLHGSGRAFCAGGDVKGMGKSTPIESYEHIGKLNDLILKMSKLDKPIIANVHGYAAGAGACLALASDLIVATDDSKFILSFARVGLISDGGGLFFLPRTLGLYRAKELLFLAEPVTAAKAEQWGMINRVFPAESFKEDALAFAQKLANGPGLSYKMIKRIANQSLVDDLAETLEWERTTQGMMRTSEDHLEGVNAFKEKRQPKFKGK